MKTSNALFAGFLTTVVSCVVMFISIFAVYHHWVASQGSAGDPSTGDAAVWGIIFMMPVLWPVILIVSMVPGIIMFYRLK